MQLMQFYHALNRAPEPTVNGQSFSFAWDDEVDDDMSLRITTDDDSFLICHSDRISKEPHQIVVSVGAVDYEFKV